MSWIFVDKESEGGSQEKMRSQMRRNMRGGYRSYGSGNYRDEYEHGYRMGYRHGWEDYEDDDMDYRRSRDSRGRYM